MNQAFEQEATRLRTGISANPAEAGADLVGFADRHARGGRLRHTALILRRAYARAGDPTERARLGAEMLALVDAIQAERRTLPPGAGAETQEALVERAEARYQEVAPPRGPVFTCEGLGKRYRKGGFHLQEVDLQLRLGTITGVVGENGNGKTTLFRLVAGELLHDAGGLAFPLLDQDSAGRRGINWIRVKESLAYVPQELPKWYGPLRDNLEYEAAIHGIRGADNLREVDFIIERLGLGEHSEKTWSELSGGFKLRFALARALVWKPPLLVIDEPLANLDFRSQQLVLRDLRNLADGLRHPMAVLISSQHLHEIEAIADAILFLEQGRVKFSGPIGHLGAGRGANTFELRTPATEAALRDCLAPLAPRQVQDTGVAYVITLPLTVTHRELLRRLLDAGIEVEYFRDISRSIKQLFH